jgi:hypothetical protein
MSHGLLGIEPGALYRLCSLGCLVSVLFVGHDHWKHCMVKIAQLAMVR